MVSQATRILIFRRRPDRGLSKMFLSLYRYIRSWTLICRTITLMLPTALSIFIGIKRLRQDGVTGCLSSPNIIFRGAPDRRLSFKLLVCIRPGDNTLLTYER